MMSMNTMFITENEAPEIAAMAAEAFAEDNTAPFVEIDGVMIPNRIFFDD